MNAYGIFQGGGAKGYAHVGALKAAEERSINFTRYGGTSAGAIIASLAAAGYTADELLDANKPLGERGILDLELSDLLDPAENKRVERVLGRVSRSFGIGVPAEELLDSKPAYWLGSLVRVLALAAMEIRSIGILRKRFGFIRTEPVIDWLDGLLAAKIGCRRPVTFADLDMRLKVVAANLTAGKIEKFGFVGDEARHVATATMASACFPFFFRPVVAGDMFVDGGMLSNLPVWLFDDERDDETSHLPTFGFRLVSGALATEKSDEAPTGLRSFANRIGKTILSGGANLWRSHILLVQSLLVSRLMYRFSDPVLKGGSSWWNGLGRLAISGMRGERPSARN
jgi:NTE family protein